MKIKSNITVSPVSDSYMNLNTGSVLYDFIETIMDFCVAYPLFALLLYGVAKDSSYIVRACLLIVIVFLMVIIRNYVKNNLLHYVSYIPVIAAAYFVPGSITAKAADILFIIIMMGISISKRKRGHIEFRKLKYMLFSEIFLFAVYLVSIGFKYNGISGFTLFCSILFGTIFLIYMHTSRLDTLMIWEGQKSSDDKKKINSIGIKTSVLILSVLLVFTFIMYNQGYFRNVDNALVSWISTTFSPRPHEQKEQQQQQKKVVSDDSNMDSGIPDDLKKPVKKNIFIDIFIFITEFIAAAVALIVIYILLKSMIKGLIELAFGRKQKNNEKKESLLDIKDIKESINDMYKTLRKNGILNLSMTNNSKIRRTYYSIVNKKKKRDTIIMPSYTPFLIKSVVESDSNIDMEEATLIYEKARYGNKECTDEELTKIRDDANNGKLKNR